MEVIQLPTLEFGTCKNCGHQVAFPDSERKHHITRSRMLHAPRWPDGHVIITDCKWKCGCILPELDESKGKKSKMVILGSHTDHYREIHGVNDNRDLILMQWSV